MKLIIVQIEMLKRLAYESNFTTLYGLKSLIETRKHSATMTSSVFEWVR